MLTLIEGKKPPGIFSLLDDMGATAHAMESHAVDAKALEKLKGSCSSNAHFRGMDTAFSVKHYAGTVTYEINGFIEKNKDTLFPDLIETMQSSTNPFIVALFPEDTSSSQNKRPTTAGFKIKSSAADLMTALSRCSPHYIRWCVCFAGGVLFARLNPFFCAASSPTTRKRRARTTTSAWRIRCSIWAC